jgi:hypothetical protein
VTHLDWGHGPNTPVLTFTEDEIRAVMKEHEPTDIDCECSCSPMTATPEKPFIYFSVDHLIDMLKEARRG